ncbi:MAG TPA: 3'(2'),5'-bisphosphate nucleotidase CysQ [Nitrospiraceae bacterium]|jgi:myo-inositol-1(or 4)-monophosphatase|nr:3'(2'),5'-bisphosphate nucleotidase CysQ [Nitrospiraceae bacterium]
MQRELDLLLDTVRLAGTRALELARNGFDTHRKADRSPVTSVDLEVNRLLQERLLGAFPDDGWLSEETPDSPARLEKKRVWIVDPIDGTNAFIKGLPEFCISVALVEGDQPIVGAVLNPVTNELFTAVRGQGFRLNGNPPPPAKPAGRPVILVNPWELSTGRFDSLREVAVCRPMHSIAYALVLVAAGRVDAALTFEREHEWDLAAGVLLIQEAGGTVTDGAGKPFRFNQPRPSMQGTVAVAPGSAGRVEVLIHRLMALQRSKTRT